MEEEIGVDLRFSIVPRWLLDTDLPARAIRLYAVLAGHADSETRECFPSRSYLAQKIQSTVRTVDAMVEKLEAAGAITKTRRIENNEYKSSLYVVHRVALCSAADCTGSCNRLHKVVQPTAHRTRTTEQEPLNKSARAHQMEADWKPPAEAAEKYPSLNIAEEVEAFKDYHLARGSRFKDWDRAFWTWCRRSVKYSAPKTVIHKQATRGPAEVPGSRDWVAGLHRSGEHYECKGGEFGHPEDWEYEWQ